MKEFKIGKLNILDLAIIFICIVFLGIFIINLNSKNNDSVIANSQTTSNKFTYNILIEGLSETSSDMFQIEDEVYDKVSNTLMGKIKEIKITEAVHELEKKNGQVIKEKFPKKIDVNLTIETNGTIKNNEYLANGLIRILVGNERQIKTKYIMCMGLITEIE